MYCCLGYLQREFPPLFKHIGLRLISTLACISLPLHLSLAKDPSSLPSRQPGLGVPEVRKIEASLPLLPINAAFYLMFFCGVIDGQLGN